jgi:hypothetical protein
MPPGPGTRCQKADESEGDFSMTVLENSIGIDAPPARSAPSSPRSTPSTVRKKWNDGIKGFFDGLNVYVETGRVRSEKA